MDAFIQHPNENTEPHNFLSWKRKKSSKCFSLERQYQQMLDCFAPKMLEIIHDNENSWRQMW